MLTYSLARIGLFAACFLVVWVLWLRGLESDPGRLMRLYPDQVLIAMVVSAVASLLLSVPLLRGLRNRASDRINRRVTTSLQARAARRGESEQDEDAEDAEAEVGPAGRD